MNRDTIKETYNKLQSEIDGNMLRKALDSLRSFCGLQADCAPQMRRIEELEQRYFYMLRMLAGGTPMPTIESELDSIRLMAGDIAADIYAARLATRSDTLFASQLHYRRLRPEENLQSLVSDYLSELERLRTDAASLTDSRRSEGLERLANDVFMALWVELPFGADVAELVGGLLEDEEIPLHHRVLWLNAVGLGTCELSDRRRHDTLLKVHSTLGPDLSAVAAVWLVVGTLARAELFTNLTDVCAELDASHPGDAADVFLELFRACAADNLATDINRNVMPDLMNMGKGIADKLAENPDDVESALLNSEWSAEIGTEGFDKIKSFIESQNNGNDVYMATLGRLRQFPFFNSIPNWFLPFNPDHSALAEVTDGEGMAFADGVDKMPWLCDGDKYALILSVAQTPPQLRDNLLRNLADTHAAMDSEATEQARQQAEQLGRRLIMNRWVKNLYRFFTLFRRKAEFPEVFKVEDIGMHFPGSYFVAQPEALGAIARLVFDNKEYDTASSLLHYYLYAVPDDVKALQQYAFALEKSNQKQSAAEAYSDALLHKPGDIWTTRRLAQVLYDIGDHIKVMELLEPMESKMQSDPELMKIYASLLLEKGDGARALDVLYNLEYVITEGGAEPTSEIKSEQAWAMALAGDLDGSLALWDSPGTLDVNSEVAMICYGIVLWCAGQHNRAIDVLARARTLAAARDHADREFYDKLDKIARTGISPVTIAALKALPDMVDYRIYGSNLGKL